MKDYLKEYGITPYINAHDTITLYGGSRMPEESKEAMDQISRVFVDMDQLQQTLGRHIASVTHNEGAYIANSAAGAIKLCTAVCLARGEESFYKNLPDTKGLPADEIVVIHAQHNCYDKAIEAAGARLRLVGDADEILPFDLKAAVSERCAAVYYFPASIYRRGSMPLSQVVRIAHEQGVPVVVDAAAQLPPVENLWRFTGEGADLVIFSGGKTLMGPQSSGLIVGKLALIEDCLRFGSPAHGICRDSKVSREGMIGLAAAIDRYLALDQREERKRMSDRVDRLIRAMSESGLYQPYRKEHGSVGQDYPRAFARISPPYTPGDIVSRMKERGIFIGEDRMDCTIYISPLNLTDEECITVGTCLKEIGKSITL